MSSRGAWSVDDVMALPVVVPLTTAGQVLGRGRTAVYADHRAGRLPFEVLTLGSRLLVRRADLLAILGLAPATISRDAADA